jgi:hypothetical protein
MQEGYLLCCFGENLYFQLTLRAIGNIRQFDISRTICVLTDNPEYFSGMSLEKVIFKPFNYTDHIYPQINYSNSWNKFGLIPKLFQCLYTPFEITMFVDVDNYFFKDFTFVFNMFREKNQPLLMPGVSDANGRSPPDWHWNTIEEVMEVSQMNFPQVCSTAFLYHQSFTDTIVNHIQFVFEHLQEWKIKSLYRDGYPDEIIYSILCGLKHYKVDIELYTWLHTEENCNTCWK